MSSKSKAARWQSCFPGGTGSIDLDGLTPHGQSNNFGLLIPSLSVVSLAPPSPNFAATDWYTGISAPANFGSGGVTNPTSFSGDVIDFDVAIMYIAQGYSSKTPLSATETFSGATFASLGVVPGTYTWHWGSVDRGNYDTMTLEISAVPEPASLAVIGTGLAAVSAMRRRKRA